MSSLTKAQLAQLLATQNTTSTDPVIIEADQFIGDLVGTANLAKRLEKSYRLSVNGDAVGSCLLNADDTLLTLQVTHSDTATQASTATNANNAARASLADLANLASFALKSRLATLADKATEATHASAADTATNANHATRADTASYATNAGHASTADSATYASTAASASNATHAINADHATVADLANVASALNFTIIKVVTAYPQTLDDNALYVLVNNDGAITGIKTKDKTAVDFDIMTVDVLSAISESTVLKDGKLYAVPGEEGTGTKLDPKSASVVFKRKVQGIDVYYQVSGGGGSVVLPEASTTQKGIVQLSNTISQTETKAVTPKAIDDLKDDPFVTMSTAQYVYATKTELENKSLSTAQYVNEHFVTLSTAQYVSGLKEFNDILPRSSLTPTLNGDMTTKTYVDGQVQNAKDEADGKFVTLSTAQYVRNLKTFNDVLPQSLLTPTDDKDFATKKFIDDLFLALKNQTANATVTFGGINQMNFNEE